MASAKTHQTMGTALWIFFFVFLVLSFSMSYYRLAMVSVVGFCFTFLGSIIPDIDNRNSRVFKRVRFFTGLTTFVIAFVLLSPRINGIEFTNILYLLVVCGLATLGVILILHIVMPRHRGIVHSMKSGAVYGVVSLVFSFLLLHDLFISTVIAFFAFISFGSHLFLDR